ncbi:PH domain-containing protein [Staphylococcus warneri]|uniref:PH domain-containing protein n=1 Tax=Staphylococcus TaxID=1279 RepID=UPI000EC8D8E6|nr:MULTISPECIES: PH domain-containing protein [Staphylococcus]MCI2788296.1 PH domain-containing protein [Staphylococcus warneri]QSF50775.1 PH domain-containing protein [Staphylococcus sp. SB1-57]RQM96679.1 hypothetical protein CPA43_09510 [Staphylococcus warneri]HBY83235.1 hypothetical protein [Staphylococcus sp.]
MASKVKNLNLVENTILHEDETIVQAISGLYETSMLGSDTVKNGVLVATEYRVIFYAKRLSGYDYENFDYDKISTFELSKKFTGHVITFYSSGNKVKMSFINDNNVKDFIKYVNKMMNNKTSEIESKNPETEKLLQIKLLKELLDMNAITEEEFNQKKEILLK